MEGQHRKLLPFCPMRDGRISLTSCKCQKCHYTGAGHCCSNMIVGLKSSPNPLGTISPRWLAVLGSTLLVVVLLALFLGRRSRAPEALFIYCAAGVKAPVEAAAREYERDSGV